MKMNIGVAKGYSFWKIFSFKTMKSILISTIIRDRAKYLKEWYSQLIQLVQNCKEYTFYISVYENDSRDNSIDILKSLDFSIFKNVCIKSEILDTKYYESIKNDERVVLLADARNKSIYNCGFLDFCDEILCIEPDIHYDPALLSHLIKTHSYDIISARSGHVSYDPRDRRKIYDVWATRILPSDEEWTGNFDINQDIIKVWSTFNCFCKYNALPFKNGVSFSGFSKRLNKYDCDTTVICESFRQTGYDNIAIDLRQYVLHGQYD